MHCLVSPNNSGLIIAVINKYFRSNSTQPIWSQLLYLNVAHKQKEHSRITSIPASKIFNDVRDVLSSLL